MTAVAGLDPEHTRAVEAFDAALGEAGSVAVAFSGGVDSTLTLALAARLLGTDRVVALLGVSPSLARSEREQAAETAAALGVRLVEVTTHEIDDAAYVANRGDRCYFCKHELYTRAFLDVAGRYDVLVNGDTADDRVAGDRPGARAGTELGVRSPLADAGIGKQQVRSLARALGLPVWDKPSAPCLASRVALDLPVTRETLARVEQAERSVRALGLRELRVRHLGSAARVELGADDLDRVLDEDLAGRVSAEVAAAGYAQVSIATTPLRRD